MNAIEVCDSSVRTIVFSLFVGWRITRQKPVPAADSGSFSPLAAQAPLPVELAFAPLDEGQMGEKEETSARRSAK